jgi:nitroreductase
MTVSDVPGAAQAPSLETLLTRTSNNMLTEPVPSDRDLETIFQAATHAPDHGRLRPWRFVVIKGDARNEFVKVLQAATKARKPEATENDLKLLANKFLMQPMIIAVGAKVTEGKIPEIEQVLSAGAAAMNILNAIHALGFAGKWVTGDNCYDPNVNGALGFTKPDRLIGFIYVGTEKMKLPVMERPNPSDFVTEWKGPAAG